MSASDACASRVSANGYMASRGTAVLRQARDTTMLPQIGLASMAHMRCLDDLGDGEPRARVVLHALHNCQLLIAKPGAAALLTTCRGSDIAERLDVPVKTVKSFAIKAQQLKPHLQAGCWSHQLLQ